MNQLTKPVTPDRSKINVKNAHERKHWAHALGITEDQLRFLVSKVGNAAAMVRKEIGILRKDAAANMDEK
jgi:Protein of unknown function (DUF3606)